MLKPHFADKDWTGDIRKRFYYLHLMLITMDERDQQLLPEGIGAVMRECIPDKWLPFLSDELDLQLAGFYRLNKLTTDDSQTSE